MERLAQKGLRVLGARVQVDDAGVCAVHEQALDHVELVAAARDLQRRAGGADEVDVSSARDEELDERDAGAAGGCEVERRVAWLGLG